MQTREDTLRKFFSEYETTFNEALAGTPQLEGTMQVFAECFVAADPHGISCGKNDAHFRISMNKGYEHYRRTGLRAMKIATLEIMPLDDHHAAVKVHWKSQYEKKDGAEELVDFDVIYLVQTIAAKPVIFGFITGDEQKVLRERGLA